MGNKEYKRTDAQGLAIDTRDVSLLLSAAAGSGKTATLTERIIASITEENPISITDMLIVTFTRSAASDLRAKVSDAVNKALAKNPDNKDLLRQSIAVGSADISTIDSFYMNVVKSNFQHLKFENGSPLSPDFRIADSDEVDALENRIMNEVVGEFYDRTDENFDFERFADNFSDARGEGNLVKLLIDHAKFVDGLIDPAEFYEKLLGNIAEDKNKPFFDTYYGKMIKEEVGEFADYAKKVSSAAADYFSGVNDKTKKAFESDLSFFAELSAALDSGYTATAAVINAPSWERSGNRSKEYDLAENVFVDIRKEYKDQIKKYAENYFSADEREIPKFYEKLEKNLSMLSNVIGEFRAKLASEKASRRICTFNDVSRLAYRLFVNPDKSPTDYALSMRNRYKAVYVDEYQDVNELQHDIFEAISPEKSLFVVGDIKQSIYKFRGSDPDIFNSLRNSWKPLGKDQEKTDPAYTIFMSENFRCDENVINFVNRVSRETFVKADGAVTYLPEDDLKFGKIDNIGSSPVTVAAFPAKSKDSDAEIPYIVGEIARLLKEGKKNDGSPIIPSDIAVLAPTGAECEEITDALTAAKIPVFSSSESSFFDAPEIALINSFVTAIDNPEKDIPLAATLRSPLFGFSMDELIRIRIATDTSHSLYSACEYYIDVDTDVELTKKCRLFVEKMTELRLSSRGIPVDRFLRKLYREFNITSLSDRERPQKQVENNLRYFYDMARKFSKNRGGGLSAFVAHIENCVESGEKIALPPSIGGDGAVSVMTIHKSKGLEFPVVFVAFCGKPFSKKSTKSEILQEGGDVAFDFKDHATMSKIVSPITGALKSKIRRGDVEERMRVLYVALTRAREKLYVVGTLSAKGDVDTKIDEAAFASKFGTSYSSLSAKCFFDWILPSLKGNETVELVREYAPEEKSDEAEEKIAEISPEYDEAALKTIKERFDFVYPHIASDVIPAKLSVSTLYPEVLDDGAAQLDEKLPELREKPLFLQSYEEKNATTAAERGTATHLFLQFCDFSAAARDVDEEISRLVEAKFFRRDVSESINRKQLKRFFTSEFFASLKSAKKVWREQRFNLILPAGEFTGNAETAKALDGETLLVQGVIDLFFIDENDKLVLCDYKTDYLTPEEIENVELARAKLTERHAVQLRYYARALSEMLGRSPDKVCIYSLPLGRELDIKI